MNDLLQTLRLTSEVLKSKVDPETDWIYISGLVGKGHDAAANIVYHTLHDWGRQGKKPQWGFSDAVEMEEGDFTGSRSNFQAEVDLAAKTLKDNYGITVRA